MDKFNETPIQPPMQEAEQQAVYICASTALENGGIGVKFPLQTVWGTGTGFVVRHEGRVVGYVNQCRHVPIELDWQPGRFFDQNGMILVCATHGASYATDDGRCLGGPCQGKGLQALHIEEIAGEVYWRPDKDAFPILET